VEIEPEELDAVEVEATRIIIDLGKLVPAEEIDRRYYDKPYYIAPSGKEGAEAFKVIRDAMEATGMIALAAHRPG
jgi:non-homologous end joining protein Ku